MCTLSSAGQPRGQATELCDGVYFPKIITVTLLPPACPDTLTLYTLFERWGIPIFLNQQVCNFEGSNIIECVCVYVHIRAHLTPQTELRTLGMPHKCLPLTYTSSSVCGF